MTDPTAPPTTDELVAAVHERLISLLGRMTKLEITVAQSRLAIAEQQHELREALTDTRATIAAMMAKAT